MNELPTGWIKKDDRADGGTSVWLEHLSNRWRIASCRVAGKRVYPMWQKVIGQKYWCVYGIYSTSEEAISAHQTQSPNRISIDEVA